MASLFKTNSLLFFMSSLTITFEYQHCQIFISIAYLQSGTGIQAKHTETIITHSDRTFFNATTHSGRTKEDFEVMAAAMLASQQLYSIGASFARNLKFHS